MRIGPDIIKVKFLILNIISNNPPQWREDVGGDDNITDPLKHLPSGMRPGHVAGVDVLRDAVGPTDGATVHVAARPEIP